VSTNLVRYASADGPAWGAVRGTTVAPMPAEYATVADVLADGAKVAQSLIADADVAALPLAGLRLLDPVPDARIFCQGANYRTHMIESGMDPDRAFNMLFTKSTASGPVRTTTSCGRRTCACSTTRWNSESSWDGRSPAP